MNQKPQVTIKMREAGNPQLAGKPEIVIELEPSIAPNTVNNFLSLVQQGFYNGLGFHRIIPEFMVQGGCPLGNGTGGPEYTIKGEFSSNGIKNDLKHERGVISMARSMHPNSAGSQFFIMVADSPHLDGEYAAFGKVISGMETVDVIVETPRDFDDCPMVELIIETASAETFGVEYPKPEVISRVAF